MNSDEQLLIDIEPEALRAAEFMQAQELLGEMVGRRVIAARLEETRIAIEVDGGIIYFFYGFMGQEKPEDAGEPGAR